MFYARHVIHVFLLCHLPSIGSSPMRTLSSNVHTYRPIPNAFLTIPSTSSSPQSINCHLISFRQDPFISLNFESVRSLHTHIVDGYQSWVNNAPPAWKKDNFLQSHSPIIITSRYGQNASIALPHNNRNEADAWNRERDYSKVAFLTFALATSIEYIISFSSPISITISSPPLCPPFRCYRIHQWQPIATYDIKRQYRNHIYDDHNEYSRRHIDIDNYPLLDEDGSEIPIFDHTGKRIDRRIPLLDHNESQCGVLIKLPNIHALFNTDDQLYQDDHIQDPSLSPPPQSHYVHVDAYPLAFLRSAGNIQASGIPSCFLPRIANINQSIRKHPNHQTQNDHNNLYSDDSDDDMDLDDPQQHQLQGGQQVLKPVASQFYNYIAHRTASRAGNHDTMKGTVTAAIAGGFAETSKDRKTAEEYMEHCDTALPSDRFKSNIGIARCPSSCRAELVYSVDVRALRNPTGRYVSLLLSAPSDPSLIPFIDSSSTISSPLSLMLGKTIRSLMK